MSKTMCEMDGQEKADKQADPRYTCKKCGALARKEKHLCKPKKLNKNLSE